MADSMFQPATEEKRDWKPLVIALVALAVVLAVLAFILQHRGDNDTGSANSNTPSAPATYAPNLPLTNVKMSQASIGTGGQIYYVTGTVTNTGDKVVRGAVVELVFNDSMGQVCQRDRESLRVVVATEPALDVADLARAPLAPKQSRDFQIPIEHISAQWDGQYPTLTIVRVTQ